MVAAWIITSTPTISEVVSSCEGGTPRAALEATAVIDVIAWEGAVEEPVAQMLLEGDAIDGDVPIERVILRETVSPTGWTEGRVGGLDEVGQWTAECFPAEWRRTLSNSNACIGIEKTEGGKREEKRGERKKEKEKRDKEKGRREEEKKKRKDKREQKRKKEMISTR